MRIASLWSRPIWSDGKHNAFPGIARFGDSYYVACRRSEGHQAPRASILVLRAGAADLDSWAKVADFDIDGDSLDPFVCVVGDRVHVYWHRSPCDWVVRSRDGATWTGPAEVDTEFPKPSPDCAYDFTSDRKWHFRIRKGPDGCYYSLARCGLASNGNPGILLYRSKDGLSWEATHTFGEGIQAVAPGGHEADLAFMDSGRAVAAIRVSNMPGGQGMIAWADPPYMKWDAYWAGVRNFGGPALWRTKVGLLLAARSWPVNSLGRCTIWEATPDGLVNPHYAPSGGDCAYQTFEDGPDGEVLLCYYSSHEWPWRRGVGHPANIYLARMTLMDWLEAHRSRQAQHSVGKTVTPQSRSA